MRHTNLIIICLLLLISTSTFGQIGHWRFNGDYTDASGNGLDGVSGSGTPVFTSDAQEGNIAITFNGTSQYLNMGNPPSIPSGFSPRTLSAWAKTGTTGTGQRVIAAFGSNADSKSMFIGLDGTTLVCGARNNDIRINNVWTAGQWTHITLTYDGATAKVYLNGALVATEAKVWDLAQQRLWIGRNVTATDYWQGTVDDVRIYSSALTDAQVAEIAAPITLPGRPTNLVARIASTGKTRLTWSDNANDETAYRIERSTSTTSGFMLLSTTPPNTTTFLDESADTNVKYYYRICAEKQTQRSIYTMTMLDSDDAYAHWKFNNDLTDASANGITGAPQNGPAVFTSPGKEGSHALSTNGSTRWVDFGTPVGQPAGNAPRTLMAWAKTTTNNGVRTLVGFGSNVVSQAMFLGQDASTLVGGGRSNDVRVNGIWQDNVWKHLAMTYDGYTARLYSDGVLVATEVKFWNLVPLRLWVGRNITTSEYWSGDIDDVRIYNRALTSQEISAIASETPPPTSPSNLAITSPNASTLQLTWTDNSNNETGFEIFRSQTSGSGFARLGTTPANTTTFVDANLTTGATYYYLVRSLGNAGPSAYSNEASGVPVVPVPPPPAPYDLDAVALSSTAIRISWEQEVGGNPTTRVEIERSTDPHNGFAVVGTITNGALVFTDENRPQATIYHYKIRAFNETVPSAYTPVKSVATWMIPNTPSGCENIFCAENGGIGIGTPYVPSGYKLAVDGKVMAEGMKVLLKSNWPDYVFEDGYDLPKLEYVRDFIKENGHLPNVPPSTTIAREGMDVESMNVILLEKIEQLSLYLIQMEERIKALEEENRELKEKTK